MLQNLSNKTPQFKTSRSYSHSELNSEVVYMYI